MNTSDKEYIIKINKIKRWYRLVLKVLMLYIRRKPELYPLGGKLPEGSNLILANHVTKLDQFIVGAYYKDSYIRFVSGENVFRNPLFRLFVEKCINVIVHMRGVSSYDTIREMTKSLKNGENVMIFPTGSMSFDGRSHKIDSSIAKLAKMCSCNLVLLKIDGGYLTQPRWGITTRSGHVSLTEHIIMSDELKKMSAKEVTDAINEHLYTDAYVVQANNPMKYKGKSLCKGLECCIYECPKCKKISGLKSSDTNLFCKCGFNVSYDEYGYLNEEDGSRYIISELCDSQKTNLEEKYRLAINNNAHEYLFGDDFKAKRLYRDGKRKNIGDIRVDVYADGVEYSVQGKKYTMDFGQIESLFVYIRNTLDVYLTQKEYGIELQGDFSSNALKYRDLYEIIKKQE